MQVVSSILNLQSSYVSDEYALTLLKESQNRIKTMAYIHESLYQNKSFTSVNFSEYIQTLVNNIVQSYSASQEKIQLSLDIEKITLSLDISIPVGLIINELVTNAIKHGFPDSQTGNITIHLKTKNNFVFLELKDNGVGFASGVDFENSHSLGLQLVNTLIEQIEGKFEFESAKNVGTRVLITFKM
jgi:two-component sensor histidine kinase